MITVEDLWVAMMAVATLMMVFAGWVIVDVIRLELRAQRRDKHMRKLHARRRTMDERMAAHRDQRRALDDDDVPFLRVF